LNAAIDNYADQDSLTPFARELVFGVMRWKIQLENVLAELLQKPLKKKDADVQIILLMGIYQLQHHQDPDYAVVNESVSLARNLGKKWAQGLVNAVLRNFLRKQSQLEDKCHHELACRTAHPQWLIEVLQQDWPDHYLDILTANNQRAPMTLRVNRQRHDRVAYMQLLGERELRGAATRFAECGVQLEAPVNVSQLPEFAAGAVSVQDQAAQLAAGLLQIDSANTAIDACSAPGGKSAHILETAADIHLIAADIAADRLQKVDVTLQRLGLKAELRQMDAARPEDWPEARFERVLLDVPCSGTGVIRRNPDIKFHRTPQDVAALVKKQAQILRAAWPHLVEGGILLYSTCSVLRDENDRQISRFLNETPDARELPINADWGRSCNAGRQLLPGEADMDGFYYARLQKTG
jgi:16S rRNA (cytosine967-C5)-methyltransferase